MKRYIRDEVRRVKESYKVPETVASLYLRCKKHLDTEEGYALYYQILKEVVDNKLPDEILYDLGADFRWGSSALDDAINRFAKEEGRYDLISE